MIPLIVIGCILIYLLVGLLVCSFATHIIMPADGLLDVIVIVGLWPLMILIIPFMVYEEYHCKIHTIIKNILSYIIKFR